MKKLRLSNIFHWLYALLMFLPFILLTFSVLVSFGTYALNGDGSFINSNLGTFIPYDFMSGTLMEPAANAIEDVVGMFIYVGDDSTNIDSDIYWLFCYWVEISFCYLMFDVIMFPINLFHRWIDKGGIE